MPARVAPKPGTFGFLAGGGETGAAIRAHDWSASALGPPAAWPQALKTAVGLMLAARQPVYVAWGPDLVSLYNDGYLPIVGSKHPGLGLPFRQLWAEIWDEFRPHVDATMAGEAQHFTDLPIALAGRPGLPLGWFTFSYTPLRDDDGAVAGFYCAATETTQAVLAARRRDALLELYDRLRDVPDPADLAFAASELLGEVLGACRVGYGAVEADAGTIALKRNWRAPGFADLAGLHRFGDYGTHIDDLRRGDAVTNADVAADARTAANAGAFAALGVRAFLDVPVVENGRTVAQMVVHSASPRVWTQGEVAFVRDFAERTHAAVARREAERALRASEARRAFLLEVSDALRPLADPHAMQAEACRLLGEHLGVAQAGFAEVDAAGERIAVRRDWNDGRIPSVAGAWRMDDFGPRFVRDMKAGGTIVIPDVALDPRTNDVDVAAAYRGIAARAILDVPLVRDGRLVALLFIHHPEPRAWTPDEAALAEEVSARLWSAVERARAEDALRSAEERHRAIFAGTSAGLVVLAPDAPRFTIADVNDAFLRNALSTREAILGRGVFEVFPENPDDPDATDAPALRASLDRALATGRTDVMPRTKYDIPRPGGGFEERWWDAINTPLLGPDGAVAAIIHHATERTDVERAERALKESEALLSAVIDQAPVGVIIADADGRIVRDNAATRELWGVPPETLGWERYGDWVGWWPDTGERIKAAEWGMARALLHGEIVKGELVENQRFDTGERGFFFLNSAAPVRGPDGRIVGGVVFQVDATERRRAELALRELNETLEARVAEQAADRDRLWDLSPDLLTVVDYEGRLLRVNPSWTRVLGYDEERLLSRPYAEMLHPDELEHIARLLAEMRETQRPVLLEDRLLAADGTWRTFVWTLSPEPSGDRLYGVGRDVTAERAREAELAATQEALRQAQKMEAMGQLTGGVAHDFNNLLTPIVGALDLLARRELGGERERRLIAGAAQSAERARTLVQRLLAFARRQPLQAVAVDCAALVGGMGDLVASTTGPQIAVVVDAPASLPPALADPNQLEMALLNLAVNARDAMPDGGTLRISVGAERVGDGHRSGLRAGDYLRLSVADTGSGMDEETLARAVEPFFSTKGVGKGTGLGLSMVHGLASQLGGALAIRSRPGLGTNIELWLPRSADAPERADADPDMAPAAAGRSGRALLVDDEELVRMSTADMLADLGYAVVEAASAEEALARIGGGANGAGHGDGRFDLLVTDHLMPGMTGTDLARAVRAVRPDLPVLLVSGYAEHDGIAPDLPRLTKPFRKDELASALERLPAGSAPAHAGERSSRERAPRVRES